MNKIFKCLIIDDEPPARALIAEFISRIPYLQSIGECNNAINTLEAIHQTKPDIIFLDINIPQMSGIELVKVLNNNCPQVIFTTAYADFALLGFDLNVTDYLLKPIRFDRFLQAVSKIYDRKHKSSSDLAENNDQKQYGSHLWIKADKKLHNIATDEILYIEGMKDYLKVFLEQQMLVTHRTLTEMSKLLDPERFLRIHRSYIVKRSAIKLVYGNTIQLISGTELPIGVSYRELIDIEIKG